MLFNQIKQEVDLSKVTKSKAHSGIFLDFYIPEYNLAVEVHGIQHYKPSSFGRDSVDTMVSYVKQLNRDDKLRNICLAKNIKLIEIPFDMEYNQILIKFVDFKNENENSRD